MIPKPKKKPKQKRNREYDSDYVKWIHGWPCCICGSHPVHAHHVVSKGAMGSDRTVIPLCPGHHLGWVHGKGVETTQKHYNVDFSKLVIEFNNKYDSGESGPY